MFFLLLSITVNSSKLHLELDAFNNSVYSDRIYMTTDNGGLVSFDPEDSSWNSVNSFSGLPSNETKDLYVRNDSIFVLSKGGITIFDGDLTLINFQDFNPFFFSDTNPDCIEIYEDIVILGGERGLQWFDLSRFGNLRRVDRMDYNFRVFEITPYYNSFLLGSNRGTYLINSNFGDTLLIDSSGETYSVFVSDSSIWAGGSWGCKEITSDTAIFSSDTVWNIAYIDEQIYIGTKSGLYRYNGSWNYVNRGNIRGVFKFLPQNLIAFVVRSNGIRFEGSSNILYPPGIASNLVTDLVQTPDGKIYVSHKSYRRLSLFDGVGWKILNRRNQWGLPGGYSFNLESDSEGRVYLGLWYWENEPVLYCLDTRTDITPRPINLPITSATTVTGMLVDSNNDLWIGVLVPDGSRVLKMHRVSEDSLEWTIYSNPEISWKRVFAEGSEGIYCGNSPSIGGVGIHILRNDESIGKVTGNLGSSTTSMASDINGNIWAGLENKLVYIEGNNIEREYTASKVDGLAVDFQGGIWCYNSERGLSYLSPEGVWESLPDELMDIESFILEDVIYPLHFTVDNTLFVCTYNGLYEFDVNFNYPDSGKVNVYPNPFNYSRHPRLSFSSRDIGGKDIFIYDIVGNIKGEYVVPSGREVFWIDREQLNLSSGLYMYFVTEEGKVIYKGKFVVVR